MAADVIVKPGEIEALIAQMLRAAGVVPDEAALVAAHLVDAEARGYGSQGLMRVANCVRWARGGEIASPTRVTVERDSGAALVIDAHHGWGHVAALRAMDLCAERAATNGACLAVMRNVTHIGRLGYYVEAAAARSMIGLIACSGGPHAAWMAPWGGTRPVLSTNPLAIGFPRRDGPPVVIDMSTTQTSRGKVLLAQRLGEQLPVGWAFDRTGNPTRDPHEALPPRGSLAPAGGHKGYALAVAIEILCGVLSGIWPPEPSGNFVGAIRVDAFLPLDAYEESVSGLTREIKSGPMRPGFDEILLPGEGSARRRSVSLSAGLRIPADVWQEISDLARELGVNLHGHLG